MTSLDQLKQAIRSETRLVWVETPTNPLLGVVDIAGAAEAAHAAGALCAVDNTFATPFLQRPLELGADLVVHSSTKYLGGHSDVVGGALVRPSPSSTNGPWFLQNAVGAVPGADGLLADPAGGQDPCPADAGPLPQRDAVAAFPGWPARGGRGPLPGPGRRPRPRAGRPADGRLRGMVAFRPAGGVEAAKRWSPPPRKPTLAESLGGVESLIELPGEMTHASVAGTDAEVLADLVRLSVGVEHPDDLVADLARALDRA